MVAAVMTFKITAAMMDTFNAAQYAKNDKAFAKDLRAYRPDRVQHISDEELTLVVERARELAIEMGIKSPQLRARFVMIDALLIPEFWKDHRLSRLLHGPSGSADVRFGDVCAAIKRSAFKAGFGRDIWW